MSDSAVPTRSRRHWFRYSLRSLLVFTVLVGLLMGWIAKERFQSQYERQLADELQKQGYRTVASGGPYDSWELRSSNKPQGWWRNLARHVLGERIRLVSGSGSDVTQLRPLGGLSSLDCLTVNFHSVDDLTPLADLKNLHVLYVTHTSVRDLTPIAGLANLRWLSLAGTPVSDLTSLAELKNLEWLCLLDTPVSDLRPLAGLKNLESLDLHGVQVSDEQITELQQALPNCKIEHVEFE